MDYVLLILTLCIFCATKSTCCVQGSPNFNTLTQQCSSSCLIDVDESDDATIIIPDMNFTCNGTITSWRAAGMIKTNSPQNTMPQLRIWRPTDDTNTYSMISQIPLLTCNGDSIAGHAIADIPDAYDCQLSTGISVQPGDIVGFYFIGVHKNRDRFRVYFNSGVNAPRYYFVRDNLTQFSIDEGVTLNGLGLPLIELGMNIEVESMPVVTVPTTPEVTMPTTPKVTVSSDATGVTEVNMGTTMDALILQVTGGVGGGSSTLNITVVIVVLMIAVVLVLMMGTLLLVVAMRRKKSIDSKLRNKENRDIDYPLHMRTIRRQNQEQENTLGVGTYSFVEESPYDTPLQSSTIKFDGTSNPSYLYVPSGDQRKALSFKSRTGVESIYEELENQYDFSGPAPKFFSENPRYWAPSSDYAELYQQLASYKYREILRQQIKVVNQIGSGQFGTVNRGLWQMNPNNVVECAIKTLHVGASEEDQVQFLQEAAINGQFHHPNIVLLLGVVTIGEPVMIVLELLDNGDLLSYLKKMTPLPGELMSSDTPNLLLKFCQQVASGMEYLSRKAFVHRDLAARNVLVTNNKTCKISDFGMSRNITDDYYISQGGQIPVKWTAPEAIHYKKYSTASDVWSYGALMYEIWSVGRKPFENNNNVEVIRIVDSGYRLPPPPGCPKVIYHLMIQCWNPNSKERPLFVQLLENLTLSDLLVSERDLDEGDVCEPGTMMLGSPLLAAKNLYIKLQQTYLQSAVT